MALDAGSVYATLGGRFDPRGFHAFGSAMGRAGGQMNAFEKRAMTMEQRASQSFHAIGQAAKIGAGAGILGLGAVLLGATKKAADFEQQLSSLQAVTNANGRTMAALKKQAMDAGAATKYSALQAAAAQTELAKGGLSVQKILGGGLKGALALAAAGEMDLSAAATTTANALNLFGLNGSKAGHIADALATAANATTADVKDFAMALTQGGAAAKTAGLSFDQTVVALEMLASAGVKNSDAGTSLKAAITQLAAPTLKSGGLMKDLGLKFFDVHGRMKNVIEISAMLRSKLGDLTREQRLQAFTTLAGTDGMRTLAALFDGGRKSADLFAHGLHVQGTAAEVAAKKQDNLKGKIENLQGSIETAGIAIGEHFLPPLTRAAEQATEFINHLAATGQLDRFAAGVVSAGQTTIRVFGDIAHVGGDVARVMLAVGHALDLGDPHKIEAIIAAIAGFKIAGFVAPMVGALVTQIRLLATAPTLAALARDLIAMVNPITAVSVGVAALAAGIVLLSTRETAEERVARQSAQAKREQAAAVRDLHDAERATVDGKLAAQRSTLDLEAAEKRLTEARKSHKAGSLEVRQAEQDVREAATRSSGAHATYEAQLRKTRIAMDQVRVAAGKRLTVAADEVRAAEREVAYQHLQNRGSELEVRAKDRLARAQSAYTRAMADFGQTNRQASVTEINRQRIEAGASVIHAKNAAGIMFVAAQIQKLPKEKRTRLLADNQDALSKVGTLAARLMTMGHRRTVAKILADATSAHSALAALEAEIARLTTPKTVAISVARTITDAVTSSPKLTPVRAAGGKTSGPELALIGEGAGPEYVIPTEPRYRGRGIDLLMMAASDLGVPGFKKGRAPRKVPPRRSYLRLSPEEYDHDVSADEELARHERKGPHDKKAHPTHAALAARGRLAGERQTARRAHRHADQIAAHEDEANIARDLMQRADQRDDQAGFNRARHKRLRELLAQRRLLQEALRYAKPNSRWSRDIRGKLAQLGLDVDDARSAVNEVVPAETSTFTKAEQARLDQLAAQAALAGLTDTTTDDLAAARARADFLGKVLGSALASSGSRGGPAAIADIASQLQSARADVTQLSKPPDTTPDLQAQLDQANARAASAQQEARVNAQALSVFQGFTDVGMGPPTLIVNTLHPGDPALLRAVGDAAAAGVALQPSRKSSRERLGI